MKLIVFAIWFSFVSVIPFCTTIISFSFFREKLKLISVIGILFSIGLIVRDLIFYMPQTSFFDRLTAYFKAQQLCVSFYAIYLPIGLLFIIYPLIFVTLEKLFSR